MTADVLSVSLSADDILFRAYQLRALEINQGQAQFADIEMGDNAIRAFKSFDCVDASTKEHIDRLR